ncbi:ATP-binding protein [Romboutsia sp. 13368]|uniref:ATP-binding protein n=1 Tax=Romboutsia sp. 13368 TaxID=2708053 RepID=UPI0025F62999|nr:ATP-binding protein [Romboutsia sp. 13368]
MKSNLDTQENYKCNKCKDRTFILVDNEAVPCECRALREAESILRNSGISEEFSKKTFENFNYSINNLAISIYTVAKLYAKNFKDIECDKYNSVIFMGRSGCGKTHLSLAIANYFMQNGIGVVYMNYREDMTAIKQNILDPVVYNKYLNRYKNARVLLIDDLFKGNITPSDINIIFEIINYRYFNNKPIIVSTEKYKSDLLKIDEAIGSRILEMCDKFNIQVRGNGLNYRING